MVADNRRYGDMSKTQLQSQEKLHNIDFDYWSEIARTDPETFERMRDEVISACIDNAPRDRQQRLRGLQWQIDCLRAQSSNPLSACIKISSMMWDTLQRLGHLSQDLNNPGALSGPALEPGQSAAKPAEATILSFRPLKK